MKTHQCQIAGETRLASHPKDGAGTDRTPEVPRDAVLTRLGRVALQKLQRPAVTVGI
jgi:hypothetical protein